MKEQLEIPSGNNKNSAPQSNGEKIGFLLFALIQPAIIHSVFNPDHVGRMVTESFRAVDLWSPVEKTTAIVVFVFCMIAGVGILDGFRQPVSKRLVGGFMIGFSFFVFASFSSIFLGCCYSIGKLGH